MKKCLLFFVLYFLLASGSPEFDKNENPFVNTGQASFDWLIGSWKRTNDKEGMQTYEDWEKISESELRGKGYTLSQGDTVWQEQIRLLTLDGSWDFEVKGQKKAAPTVFRVTKLGPSSFTCENKDNDFPKKIRYAKVDKGLNAVISGDGKVVLFEFIKLP